jgi:hypothetical protein
MIISPFEYMAVNFLDAAIGVAAENTTSLILSSPLSARSPDLSLLWHDGFREKHRIKLLRNLLAKNIYGFLKGAVKLAVNFKPLRYAVHGKINSALLVVTSTCGFEASNGSYKTAYVHTDNDDGIFVFGPVKTCGKGEKDIKELALRYKLSVAMNLMRSGMHAFIRVKGSFIDKTLLLLLWIEWVVSLQWLYAYYLERALSEVVEKHNISKIGCIHEMHFYARVVWRVASKYNARGYTIQHAAITPGKRWYFCYPDEKKNGLMLPDVMYVFNKDIIEMLKPHYDSTKFLLGCSSRYSHWKDITANRDKKGEYYLFAGALAEFDNNVLLESLREIVEKSARPMKVRLRLHPYAQIGRRDKKWLKLNLNKGLIEISHGISLKDDIERAIAVIGMSTTVLEEALLLGCPVVQLTHHDYLQYIDLQGIQGASTIGYRDLSSEYLVSMANNKVDHKFLRDRLGLTHPTVTYSKLFEA